MSEPFVENISCARMPELVQAFEKEVGEDEGDDGKFEYWESLLRKMRGKLCNKGL